MAKDRSAPPEGVEETDAAAPPRPASVRPPLGQKDAAEVTRDTDGVATGTKPALSTIEWKVIGVPTTPIKDRPVVARKRYWCGTRRDCPLQNVVAGPTCFPMYLGTIEVDEGRKLTQHSRESIKRGAVYQLSEATVKEIQEAVGRYVIRRVGTSGQLWPVSSQLYEPNAQTDVPLAELLFMVCIDGNMPHDWREHEPPPMAVPKP